MKNNLSGQPVSLPRGGSSFTEATPRVFSAFFTTLRSRADSLRNARVFEPVDSLFKLMKRVRQTIVG